MDQQMKITVMKDRSTDLRTLIFPSLIYILFMLFTGDDWQASLIQSIKFLAPMILVAVVLNLCVAHFISNSQHYQIDDQRLRFASESATFWQVPLIHITKVETTAKKGKVVEAIIYTHKDSFQMMELNRFDPADVQTFLSRLEQIASSNLATQYYL